MTEEVSLFDLEANDVERPLSGFDPAEEDDVMEKMEIIEDPDADERELHDANRPIITNDPHPLRGGGLKLYDAGFLFFRDKSSPDGSRIYWRCKYKSQGCFARLHTLKDTGEIVHRAVSDHNHAVNCPPAKHEKVTRDDSLIGYSGYSGKRSTISSREIARLMSSSPPPSKAGSSRHSDGGAQLQRALPHLRSRPPILKRPYSPPKKGGHTKLEDALQSLAKSKQDGSPKVPRLTTSSGARAQPPPKPAAQTSATRNTTITKPLKPELKSGVATIVKSSPVPHGKHIRLGTDTTEAPKSYGPPAVNSNAMGAGTSTGTESLSASLSVVKRFLNLSPAKRRLAEDMFSTILDEMEATNNP